MEDTQPEKQTISMREAITKHFKVGESDSGRTTFLCRHCGTLLMSVTGVSKHWRTKHQHETRIYIV